MGQIIVKRTTKDKKNNNKKKIMKKTNMKNKYKQIQLLRKIINQHITAHSKIMVMYRQTKNRSYLERAQQEINTINTVLATVEKMELMSLLSRG